MKTSGLCLRKSVLASADTAALASRRTLGLAGAVLYALTGVHRLSAQTQTQTQTQTPVQAQVQVQTPASVATRFASPQSSLERRRAPVADTIPQELLGTFRDDYGSAYRVSESLFEHLPRAKYHIVEWHVAERYLIARNGADNVQDAGLWTRIDWMELTGMAPYTWGFCLTAFKAPTVDAARTTPAADRRTPRTGCGGFPFSRMQRTTMDAR